jgi:hypothetical protein
VRLEKKLKLRATTSTDSTLVAGGDVKRTKKQLAAGEPTKFTAMLTQSKWKQLKEEKDAPKPVVDTDGVIRYRHVAKIKVKVTDEFGQTATEEFRLRFMRDE